MNAYIQNTARQLMQLHALEERLSFFEEQDKDAAELEALIEALRAHIPKLHLARHDRMRAQHKRSVAECRQGVCAGCHMKVAIGSVPALQLPDTVQTCEHCGRFLYASEQQPIPAAAPAAPPRKSTARAVKPAGNPMPVPLG